MKSRGLKLVLLGAGQLVSGAGAFLLWAGASYTTSAVQFADAQTALSWAMVIFMPVSMGLPYLLANYSRPDRVDGPPRFAFAIRTAVYASLGLALSALTVSLLSSSTTSSIVALSLAAASCLLSATIAQQVARIRMSMRWLALGLAGPIMLPLAIIVAGTVSQGGELLRPAAILLACGAGAVGAIGIYATRNTRLTSKARRVATSVLTVSLPLVPHLLAISVLLQGVRFTAVVGASSAALVTEAAYLMQFAGIGFAVIASVHGLLAASTQRLDVASFTRNVRRFAWGYGALGAVAAGGVMAALMSPLTVLFRGFIAPSWFELSMVGAAQAAIAGYYFQSTLLVRSERTRVLPVLSVAIVAMYIAGSLQMADDLPALLCLFALAALALHFGCAAVAMITDGARRRQIVTDLGVTCVGYLPPAVILIAAWSTTQP